jgi:antagonist of KipI
MAVLKVVRPGMLTTVQDLGRWGHQELGVPVAGPMDVCSHRLANRLAGNVETAAALELTLLGPELEPDVEVTCALAGAEFSLDVDGRPVDTRRAFLVAAHARLRFGERRTGMRATLAVRGGLDLPKIFGSRATSIVGRMGPVGGRALAAGDLLPVGIPASGASAPAAFASADAGHRIAMPRGGARLRVILGPHDAMFRSDAIETLLGSRYVVTPQSNRMGYRLAGPPLRHIGPAEILSDATPVGSLQVPASGQPILLMADRQTTGGYPKIATVITADLPVAGQLAPGDWMQFAVCTRAAAVAALRAQDALIFGTVR